MHLRNLPSALLLLLPILLVRCADSEPIIPGLEDLRERHVIKVDGYDCAGYQTLNFLDPGESINKLLVVDNILYFANFDQQLRAYSLITNTVSTIAEDLILINEMEVQDGTLYICTWSGIYTIEHNDPATFARVWPYNCNASEVNSSGEIFVTGLSHGPDAGLVSHKAIYRLTADGQEIAYGPTEDALHDFELLDNGSVLAFNQSNTDKVYRFDPSGTVSHTFTDENAPLGKFHFESEIWTLTRENKFLIVLKNGLGIARILEWNDNTSQWHSYLEEATFGDLNDQEVRWIWNDVVAPSYLDIALEGQNLLIPTNLAGCRGLQRFRLQEGELLRLEDIDIIRDEDLGIGHCLQGIQLDPGNNRKFIYGQRAVAVLEGCD